MKTCLIKGKMLEKKLWTKNFTIITVGSVISMIGNSLAGFATGLLVLDYTESTFLYALYMVLYTLPQVLVPSLAGPFIDKFSRRKTIYMLDFISGIIYALFALIVFTDNLNYVFLVVGCTMIGAINSIYMVTYDSFYPMLITEGYYSKAYSVASTLESLTALVVPISVLIYNLIGIGPLFLIDTVSFFVAAIMETRIHVEEKYVKKEGEVFGLHQYRKTFVEGIAYLRNEKGLMAITLYFSMNFMCGASLGILLLPYFRSNIPNGEYFYLCVMGCMFIGRMVGGGIHYKRKIKPERKFLVAILVYTTISIIEGSFLYFPIAIMMVMNFMDGILGITSYNIRIAATQSYIPHENKGRFNGIFLMLTTIGNLIGQFMSGLLSEFFPERYIISAFMSLNLLAVFIFIYGRRKHVKKIYNRET